MISKIMTLAVGLAACFAVSAQPNMISKPVADAFNAHKCYMKLAGVQTSEGYSMKMNIEIAIRGEASMSRTDISGNTMVTLSDGTTNFMLDEARKTYRAMPNNGDTPLPTSNLKFVRHGKCTLNGDNYVFDEYKDNSGTVLTCYYNSNKVSAIEIVKGSDKFGPMNLLSFSSAIPSKMYFCLGADWKGSAAPMPPRCSSPWHETEASVELACGTGSAAISVTGKVEAETGELAVTEEAAKPDEYSESGVQLAVDELIEETKGMSDREKENYLLVGAGEAAFDIAQGKVTAKTVERAVARCVLCPHSVTYLNAGTAVREASGSQKAIPFFESAEKLSPGNPVVATSLFDCYIELGNLPKAESVARTATAKTPDSGMLWQKLAAICWRKQNYRESARALCKSMSLGYFDDISAGLCLLLYDHAAGQMTENPLGCNFYDVLKEIFTDENVANLEKAAAVGHDNIVPKPAKEYSNAWNTHFGNLEYAHDALSEMGDGYGEEDKKLRDRASKTLEESDAQIYLMMGLTPMLYSFLCSQKQSGNPDAVLDLPDAREFWANYMLMLYYQSMIGWVSGGQGHFKLPSREAADNQLKSVHEAASKQIDSYGKERDAEWEDRSKQSKGGFIPLMMIQYELNIKYGRLIYNETKVECNNVMSIERAYYGKEIRPLLDEYYEKTSRLVQYISDTRIQTYFLDMMMSTMYGAKEDIMILASGCGSSINSEAEAVELWEKSLAELKNAVWKSERDQYREHKRELQLMDAYVLRDYNEKEKHDNGLQVIIGTSAICGTEIRFRFGSDGISMETTDKRTGHTTVWGSDGFYTRDNYLMAYDSQQAHLQKAYFEHQQKQELAKAVLSAIAGLLPPLAGKGMDAFSNLEKAGKFKDDGKTTTVKEAIVTTDANGHLVQGHGMTKSSNYLGGGVTMTTTHSFVAGRHSRRDYLGVNSDGPLGVGVSYGAYSQTTGMK